VRLHFAFPGIALRALLGMAVLVAACQTALADPTSLICDTTEPQYAGPATVDLNEAKSTVTIHFPGSKPAPPLPGPPAYTVGPSPATFSPTTITFTQPSSGGGTTVSTTYVTNRLTATVEETGVTNDPYRPTFNNTWSCHVGTAQF
jgi:hypothetical protein